jgi:OHCU decarboxylase
VDPERLFFRHKLTPYAGRELFGVVQTTFLRGEQIYSAGQFAAGRHGIVLRRTGSSPTSGRLQALNSLHPDEARKTLLNCCGSTAWVEAMSRGRPFADVESLLEAAEQAADLLQDRDWKEAFAAHPRIGEQKITAPEQAKNWSQQEQAGTAGTPAEVQKTLQQLNEEYYSRFGYIFIVCATGKSAEEMLTSLEQRLKNDPAKELKIAAEEQRKITKLRLQKLVSA